MTIRPELIQRLRDKRAKLSELVSREKLDALHARGQLSARERIGELVTAGSFQEFGLHAAHSATHFGMAGRTLPADGVIAGTGYGGDTQVLTRALPVNYSVCPVLWRPVHFFLVQIHKG